MIFYLIENAINDIYCDVSLSLTKTNLMNLIFLNLELMCGLGNKTQDWDYKIKHGNEMLAKSRAKLVFEV